MSYRFSQRVGGLQSTAIREILQVVNRPDVISFAGGLPDPKLFPTEHIAELSQTIFRGANAGQSLQYSETEGHPGLRDRIIENVPFAKGTFDRSNVLVTQGSQQGIDLLAKLFLDPGDEVLVESPSYLGALQVFRFFGAKITYLPCDEEGLVPEALAEALLRKPKLLYVTPTFQNPTGLCYPESRRAALRKVLAGSDVLLVEDDPYHDLWYDTPPPAPLTTGMDPKYSVYLGSFSKTSVPGLRVGFLISNADLVKKCVQVKQATDLQTNTFGQHLLYHFLGEKAFSEHVGMLRKIYGSRRDAFDLALRSRLGGRLQWRKPSGGMFFWARLAEGGNAKSLLPLALDEGLAFVSGAEFFPAGQGMDTIRLNFTHADEDRLREGVERLTRAFDKFALAR
jgi:2-aminoadipate transaminase